MPLLALLPALSQSRLLRFLPIVGLAMCCINIARYFSCRVEEQDCFDWSNALCSRYVRRAIGVFSSLAQQTAGAPTLKQRQPPYQLIPVDLRSEGLQHSSLTRSLRSPLPPTQDVVSEGDSLQEVEFQSELHLAHLLLRQNKAQAALAVLERLLPSRPQDAALIQLQGQCLEAMSNSPGVRDALEYVLIAARVL